MKAATARSKTFKVRFQNAMTIIENAVKNGKMYVYVDAEILDAATMRKLHNLNYKFKYTDYNDSYKIEW